MKMKLQHLLIMAGLLLACTHPAQAAGLIPSPSLLPPGYAAIDAPLSFPATQPSSGMEADPERTGMGEAELTPEAPSTIPASASDTVDLPPQSAPYTQGITTGPKAYNEGNFTFKAR